jgi:hypothetical protein
MRRFTQNRPMAWLRNGKETSLAHPPIKINARLFLTYIADGAGRNRIMKDQVRYYNDPTCQAHAFYGPVTTALKNSVISPTPDAILDACVRRARAEYGQQAAFEAITAGFRCWYTKINGTGVPLRSTTWSQGPLTITLRDLFGVRLKSGKTLAVLPYVGSQELSQAEANIVLRIMELSMDQIQPMARPVVLDTRRGKPFMLRSNTNRRDLDAAIVGEVARYIHHWRAAAA